MQVFSILSFALVILFNGWLIQLLVYRSLNSQDNGSANSLERVFVGILADILLISWLGVLLAELGWFSVEALTVLMLMTALGLFLWARGRGIFLELSLDFRGSRYDIFALGVLLIAGLLYFRPNEWITGGEDPGTYVNTGINLSQTGGLIFRDQVLFETDPALSEGVLYSPSYGPGREGIRFPGFYVQDANEGTVVPQFLHVLPIWIAVLYQIGGGYSALLATPLFGLLSLLALYLLGKRLIHPGAGLFAMALLSVNISQIWYARSAFADIVIQFLLISGFYMLALFVESDDKTSTGVVLLAIIAGACFGISHLTKLDVFIAPAVVLGIVYYVWFIKKLGVSHVAFLAVYLLLFFHSVLHGHYFSRPYVTDIFGRFSSYLRFLQMMMMIFSPLAFLIIWQRDRLMHFLEHLSKYRKWVSLAFVVIVLNVGLYAYFVRPLRADLGAMGEEELATQGDILEWLRPLSVDPDVRTHPKEVRTFIEEGMVRTAWYMTPIGIWLGIAGFLYWTTTKLSLKSAPFLLGGFTNAVLLFYRGTLVPHYFWAFKRYIPLVIPAFVLLIAFILKELWSIRRYKWQLVILPMLLGSFLFVSYVRGSIMFWGHIEWKGAIEDVGTLAEKFPEDSVLLFRYSPSGLRSGLPLLYIHNHDLFLVDKGYENNSRLLTLIQQWKGQGRSVYWLENSSEPSIEAFGPIILRDEMDISWPMVPHEKEKLPDRIASFSPNIRIYEIEGTSYSFSENLNINFGDRIKLLGYEIDNPRVVCGSDMQMTLHWQALQSMKIDYTVFTHLLDDDMNFGGQKDGPPVNGGKPTTSWVDGEIIHDSITIPVYADACAGTYRLQVGLYDLETMDRLPVVSGHGEIVDDKAVLESIEVVFPTSTETEEN
jgi:4-amino-4-deoxy-L-arabinose transferase-like glycosyltransferase